MKQPTVIFIITKLELGGAQKVCLQLYHKLKAQGYRTYLISGCHGPLAEHIKDDPNTFLLPSLTREIGLKGILNELTAFYQLTMLLRRLKKESLHCTVHTHSTKAGIIGRWAALCAGIGQRIHTIHGFAFHEFQSRITWCAIYLCELLTSIITTHFICVSEKDARTGTRLLPFFGRKHTIIRAAIDEQQFTPAATTQRSNDLFVFGTVACFKPQKNLSDLIRAFQVVHKAAPHTRLQIIGDGVLRPQITTQIHEYNLEKAITLLGWQKEVAAHMRFWHAFALSSLWEGLPCAIVEACYLKLPVICYNVGGIDEVVTSGYNGQLVAPGDWEELSRHMKEIALMPARYSRYQAAPDRLAEFTIPAMLAAHDQLYASLKSS